jgi:Na+/proline symporter
MLLQLVIAYLVLSVAIGLYAATRVHNARDYITAGRNLPMPVVLAMVFATWFGAETVLGISATFLDEGFRGLISDPRGGARGGVPRCVWCCSAWCSPGRSTR